MTATALLRSPIGEPLDHSSHAMAVIAPDLSIKSWSPNYPGMLELPPSLAAARSGYRCIVEQRLADRTPEAVDFYLRQVLDPTLQRAPLTLPSGRLVHLHHLPMDDGSLAEICTSAQHIDDITNLPNRNRFLQQLDRTLRDQQRSAGGTLFFVSLDDFQDVNDFLGHAFGNTVLRGVGTRLASIGQRNNGLVARLTGVEYAILKPDISTKDDAAVFAEQVIHDLSRRAIVVDSSYDVDVSVSVGIARYPFDGDAPSPLMRNADLALSAARADRTNRYRFFTDSMTHEATRLGLIKLELRQAMERNELSVYYQPKVDLRTSTIIGMEALLRWHHPEHGEISPAEFVPVAERTGLIAPISNWMMREACKQTRAWHDSGAGKVRLAVNLSSVQFRRQSVVGAVIAILEDTCLDPRHLELEVTESLLLDDNEVVIETFKWLKHLGIPVAIDDFGTGYSSLSYLMRFPADTVKIDSSFVRHLHVNSEGATITRAIIRLAHSLNMKVVAEGVELPEHLMLLSEENCDIGQGYLFGRPMPAAEFDQLLRQQPTFTTKL